MPHMAIWVALQLCLVCLTEASVGSWCQADPGSCIGQRHSLEKKETPTLKGEHYDGTLRLADWDGDGDTDVLVGDGGSIWFHERLAHDAFRMHELVKLRAREGQLQSRFEVVDWDGDKHLDLLLCTMVGDLVTVSLLNRSSLLPMENISEFPEIILLTHGSTCDMLARDFDEDGDVDLILGDDKWLPSYSRYFERISAYRVVERTGDDNPLSIFNGSVQQIADIDGDGRLEIFSGQKKPFGSATLSHLHLLRRAADGSLVEMENSVWSLSGPFGSDLEVVFFFEIHVADWNSDGLPDVLKVSVVGFGESVTKGKLRWWIEDYRQHVLDLDMKLDVEAYGDIEAGFKDQEIVVDWNGDGFADLVVLRKSKSLHLYEHRDGEFKEVLDVFQNVTASLLGKGTATAVIVDWDIDGDLDLIISTESDGKLHYHEMVSGNLCKEELQHPFQNITIAPDIIKGKNYFGYIQPVIVDWDNDGDMDLFLGPPDGRYFEQLSDGTLREWPREESPVSELGDTTRTKWDFVDCDADGDYDLLRMEGGANPRVQVCEHKTSHVLRCDDAFPCLGTNLSKFRPQKTGWRMQLGNVADGRLKFITYDFAESRAVLWSSGICLPADPCHSKGLCLNRRAHCSCIAGHELADCSGCEPHFYSVQRKVGQMHDCKACPGARGKVCYGRGSCFDDAAGKMLAEESTARLMATGNGSCSCNEVHFYGKDEEGRSTCIHGICPAGTEENDGSCNPCAGGTFSSEGGSCTLCLPGTFSFARGSMCLTCAPGTVSTESGASECDACPAGTYEVDHQLCNECAAGLVSARGSNTCTKCPAGSHAPKSGSITCESCAAGTYAGEASTECRSCPSGTISSEASGSCSPCDAGSFAKSSLTCEQCPGGTFSNPGSKNCQSCLPGKFSLTGSSNCSDCLPGTVSSPGSWSCDACPAGTFASAGSSVCEACPVGHVSSPNSGACESCESIFIRSTPDDKKQSCQVLAMDVVLGLIFLSTCSCFSFLSLTGFSGRIPISDVSAQGQKVVVTTSTAHGLHKWACPKVTFAGTDVPDLESSNDWTIKALSLYQVTLHGESPMSLDTSKGHLYVKFPQVFWSTGLWHCPLLLWCLLFLAASAGLASQLTWSLTLLLCALGLCAGFLAFALRRRQGEATPLVKRRRQFLKEWPLALERCSRGPDRSMTAGKLHDFLQFFETFIKERSMYYACSNIVKPLTKPFQLSFVELVGSRKIQWFASHYWGMPLRHFSDAIRKHAQCFERDWRDSAYWICTFSNSQWHVKEELGNGQWENSSFYLALKSPECKGTTMIIDELVLPLQRIWCLFEVYQTISLPRSDPFHGLLLCTSTGVLQQGKAGTDVAVAVAKTVAVLDTRGAQATSEEDRLMIHDLIEKMPGGFDTMNTFVRDNICQALEASHRHYETTVTTLMKDLTTAKSSGPTTSSAPTLPTLLTSSTRHATAEKVEEKAGTN
ncbi:unnamed protein product [Durusdinium trenchii]|uniref:EGF-like domain-containing protein n=1 Tax=Durusdinium trenchii TaxID=1381693 RepID=A0ABP0RIX9_9DINO